MAVETAVRNQADERAAIITLADRFPGHSAHKLTQRILNADFSLYENNESARQVGPRSFYSILSVIRRHRASLATSGSTL